VRTRKERYISSLAAQKATEKGGIEVRSSSAVGIRSYLAPQAVLNTTPTSVPGGIGAYQKKGIGSYKVRMNSEALIRLHGDDRSAVAFPNAGCLSMAST
jgi:hypothetical protein